MSLNPDQYNDMRSYIARRVPELAKQGLARASLYGGSDAEAVVPASREDLARRAKGEWLLALYQAEGTKVGALILQEVVADIYGVDGQ